MRHDNNTYLSGCRCTDCREAHRAYGARKRSEKQAQRILMDGRPFHPHAPHGTVNGYSYYGCGCAECTAAQSFANRRYRRNRRAAA